MNEIPRELWAMPVGFTTHRPSFPKNFVVDNRRRVARFCCNIFHLRIKDEVDGKGGVFSKLNIATLTDSQSTIKTLDTAATFSRLVGQCRNALNSLGDTL